jgi:hypothetical protein
MNKLRTRLIIVILTFAAGIFSTAGWLYFQKSVPVQLIIPNAHWEQIFFRLINDATEKAQLPQLRKESLSPDDIEIRIWRGFGSSALEAVILKRSGGTWSAIHLKVGGGVEPFDKIQVKELNEPKSGWESFWKQMSDRKLLDLPDSDEIGCDLSTIDATNYVVELNHNRTYRTYRYKSGIEKCEEAKLMNEIGEIIGLEFDSGEEQCKTTEWFACMTYRRRFEKKNE